MTRREFESLRDLPDKTIDADIQFGLVGECAPVLTFENVKVRNSLDLDLRLNGKYNPYLPSITFNFRILDVGAICRVDVNGTSHKGVRTHKHALWQEEDPRLNLPSAIPRPDLENKKAKEVWDILCREAKILHRGRFLDPEK